MESRNIELGKVIGIEKMFGHPVEVIEISSFSSSVVSSIHNDSEISLLVIMSVHKKSKSIY